MSVTIGTKGIVETLGGSDLTVEGKLKATSATGVMPFALYKNTIDAAGTNQTITAPGYYSVTCPFTGTLPAPSAVPGGFFLFCGGGASGLMLTGSAYNPTRSLFVLPTPVINLTTGSWGSAQARGTKCSQESEGPSIGLISDGFYYYPLFVTGSLQLTGIDH